MGETLTPVTEVKDLHVFLDSCLTYDKHIQALSSSYISKLCQIGQVKHNFNQQTLATIIDTLVRSNINYCSSLLANTSDNNIKTIQLIQSNYGAGRVDLIHFWMGCNTIRHKE